MLPGMFKTGGGTNDVGFFFFRFVALKIKKNKFMTGLNSLPTYFTGFENRQLKIPFRCSLVGA